MDLKDFDSYFKDKTEIKNLNQYEDKRSRSLVVIKEINNFLNLCYPEHSFKLAEHKFRNKTKPSAYGIFLDNIEIFKLNFNSRRIKAEINHTFLKEDIKTIVDKINSMSGKFNPDIKYVGDVLITEDDFINARQVRREREELLHKAKKKRKEELENRLVQLKKEEEENKRLAEEKKANEIKERKKREREEYLQTLEPKKLTLPAVLGTAGLLLVTCLGAAVVGVLPLIGNLVGWVAAGSLVSLWWLKDDERRFNKKMELTEMDYTDSTEKYDEFEKILKRYNINIEDENVRDTDKEAKVNI